MPRSFVLLFLLFIPVLIGCGPKNIGNQVAGDVTYDGRPVPKGEVVFTPDDSKGTTGPALVLSIEDGKFSSTPPKGAVTGWHTVSIVAYDGVSNEESAEGMPLMKKPHKESIEVTGDVDNLKLEIPK